MIEEELLDIIVNDRKQLQEKIKERKKEMSKDQNDHYLLYHVLGFTDQEAHEINLQQNIGRNLLWLCNASFCHPSPPREIS